SAGLHHSLGVGAAYVQGEIINTVLERRVAEAPADDLTLGFEDNSSAPPKIQELNQYWGMISLPAAQAKVQYDNFIAAYQKIAGSLDAKGSRVVASGKYGEPRMMDVIRTYVNLLDGKNSNDYPQGNESSCDDFSKPITRHAEAY